MSLYTGTCMYNVNWRFFYVDVLRMCSDVINGGNAPRNSRGMEGSSHHDIGELLSAQRGIESDKITERKVYSEGSIAYVAVSHALAAS